MKTFCEELILSANHKLSSHDIEMLDKLHKEYDVVVISSYVLTWRIEMILSKLILDRLPYAVACTFLSSTGSLIGPIVKLSDTGKILIDDISRKHSDQISSEITKMNRLLGYGC